MERRRFQQMGSVPIAVMKNHNAFSLHQEHRAKTDTK
jgi:hypothetical protein